MFNFDVDKRTIIIGLMIALLVLVVIAAIPNIVVGGIGFILGVIARIQYTMFFGNDGEKQSV